MTTPATLGSLSASPRPAIGPRCSFCQQPVAREQKFCGACGAVLAVRCERKEMTVLFLDVCGFTAMSERLDPEDVRGIMDRAFDIIIETVHAHGGTVNQFLGDGVMALFADTDGTDTHAVRGLRAAVAIQSDLAAVRADIQRAHGVDFRVRAGLHSGPVTIGVIGRGLRTDYVSRGETADMAARLSNMARGTHIVVSARTRQLARDAFVFVAVDEIYAAGDPSPLAAWLVACEPRDRVDAEFGALIEV